MRLIDFLMKIHIAAGTVALATFLVPMLTAKGGKAHRRVGWVFVTAMAVLCGTGAPASAYRLFTETRPGAKAQASFLLFITLLSGATTWKGIRVLRRKGPGRNIGTIDLAVSALLVIGGAFTAYQGVLFASPILMFFGPFGAVGGLSDLRYWLNPDKPRMHWFFEHLGDMMGASIAALTAFSALGARSLGLAAFGAAAWIGPTVILVPVSMVMTRFYRRKFRLDEPRPATSPGALIPSDRRTRDQVPA